MRGGIMTNWNSNSQYMDIQNKIEWPGRNEIYIDPLNPNPDFYSIDCIGNSGIFFTPAKNKKGDNACMRDSYWFIAGMEEIQV
jgi:hypothetical protein